MPEARIEIAAEDGCIDAFVACPDGPGPWPPVILLSDSRGPRPALDGMARRLASHGFLVLSPHLFYRAGPAPLGFAATAAAARRLAVAQVLEGEGQAEDFDAWLDYLEAERLADDVRVGVVGYGVGGALALGLAAAHAERIAAAAVLYPAGLAPEHAHHLAGCINAVLHLGYAGDDVAATASSLATLEVALRTAGVDFETEIYPAGHGFAVPDTPAHHPRAAERHWAKLVELFNGTLKPRRPGNRAAAITVAPGEGDPEERDIPW